MRLISIYRAPGYNWRPDSRGSPAVRSNELQKLLQANGILPTSQRLEVADVFLSRPQHVSAEQIIEMLEARGSRVSKATVYNTLRLFSEHGLAQELNVDPSRMFYDSVTRAHHHFFNTDTGELVDIEPHEIRIESLPELPSGTEAAGVDVVIRIRNRND